MSDDEQAAQPRLSAPAHDAACFFLQRRSHCRARGRQRRRHAKDDGRQHAERERKQRHAHVRIGREIARRLVAWQRREQHAAGPGREQQAQHGAGQREDATLHQVLANDARAARAEGEAKRDLLLTGGRPREHQVRDIGARDQQDEPHHRHEHNERHRELRAEIGQPARAGEHVEVLREEPLAEGGRRVWNRLDLLLVDLAIDDIHRRVCLRARDAGLQPCEDVEPPAAPVVEIVPRRGHLRLHHHRRQDVGGLADLQAREALRGHADNGEGMAVDVDRLVQDRGITAEAAHPVAVAEHGDRMAAGRLVVGRVEHASKRRPHAEHVEVVPADQLAVGALGLAAPDHRHRGGKTREHAGEHLAASIAEVLVHRIREGVQVHRPAHERPGAVEHDERAGIADRQGPEQHLVHQGEDRRIRADAEPQRQHDDEGEGWVLPEPA